jgi:hypothetical protein
MLTKKITRRYPGLKYLLIVLLLGFLPVTWLKSGYLIRPEEVGYLDYSNLFSKYLFSWSEHSTNGAPVSYSNHLALFPVGLIYKAFDMAGLSSSYSQLFILVLYFQVALISSYFLVKFFTKNPLVALYSSVFYGFTFYMMSTFFYTSKMIQMAIMPLLFYLSYQFLNTGRFKYICYNFLLLLLCMGLFANPANALTTLLVYPVCVCYFLVEKNNVKFMQLFTRIWHFIASTLPVICYVFLVYFYSVLSPGLYQSIRENNAFSHSFLSTKITSILQNFQGAWWESEGVYNPWISLLSNGSLIASSLFLSLLLFVGFYTVKGVSEVRKYLFWFLLVLIFIFLAKGTSEPLSFIYSGMFKYFPGFFMFRESWAKFTPILIFCSTVAFSLSLLSLERFKFGRLLLSRILPIALLINAAPFFMGGLYNRQNAQYTSNFDVKIPNYWKEARLWSIKNQTVNVLSLPVMYEDQEYYNWYEGRVGNFVGYLPQTYLFSNSIGIRDSGFLTQHGLLRFYSPRMLAFLNVDYILDQKDVVNGSLGSPYSVENLTKDGVIEKAPEKTFGKLDFYKVSAKYLLPRVYSPGNVWNYLGDVQAISLAVKLPYFPENGVWTLAQGRSSIDNLHNNVIVAPQRVNAIRKDFSSWNSGWAWPVVVSTDPSSWKYYLMRLKEFLILNLTFDPLQKLDSEIWLAAKRVSEVQSYSLAPELRDRVIRSYVEAAKNVFLKIENTDLPKRDDAFWSMVGKVVMYVKRSNQTLHALGVSEELLAEADKNYNDFVLWVEDTSNSTCSDYCFALTADRNGVYDLLLSKRGLEDVSATDIFVEVYDYVQKVRVNAYDYNGDWYKFGPINLEVGKKYKLGFNLPDASNLISGGEWLLDDSLTSSNSIRMEPQSSIPSSLVSEGVSELGHSAHIMSSMVFHKKLTEWLPAQNYEIAFDYYTSNGKLGVAVIEDVLDFDSSVSGFIPTKKKITYRRELESLCKKQEFLSGECKSHFYDEFLSSHQSTGAYIYVYSFGNSSDKFPDILIDQVALKRVRSPVAFLKYGEDSTRATPKIGSERLSPVKYKINVSASESSYDIVFGQNYNPGWRLYKAKSASSSLLRDFLPLDFSKDFVPQHYVANGYANGWVIPKDFGGGELIIEYWPQRYFYIMDLLIGLSIVFAITYVVLTPFKVLLYKMRKSAHDR